MTARPRHPQLTQDNDTDDQPNVVAYRVGQVEQALKDFRKEVLDELKNVNSGLLNLATTTYVDHAVTTVEKNFQAADKNLDDRVKNIENLIEWGWKIVVGLVLIGLLALLGLNAGSVHLL